MSAKTTKACSRCLLIRWYLMFAAPIVAAMAILPGEAQVLGKYLPTPIFFGMLVPALGVPVFLVRWIRWRRAGRP